MMYFSNDEDSANIFSIFHVESRAKWYYEAEKQMNVVIIKNSLSDHDKKFFGIVSCGKLSYEKNVLKMQVSNQ